MFIVAGMSTAAESTICMEMNQLLILQPCGGCTGCMAGIRLFQETWGHIRQLNWPRSVLCFLISFDFNLSIFADLMTATVWSSAFNRSAALTIFQELPQI